MSDPEIQRKIEKGGRGQLRQDPEGEVQNKKHPGPRERTLARTPGSEQGHESGLTEGARVRRQPGKHRPGMHEHQ